MAQPLWSIGHERFFHLRVGWNYWRITIGIGTIPRTARLPTPISDVVVPYRNKEAIP